MTKRGVENLRPRGVRVHGLRDSASRAKLFKFRAQVHVCLIFINWLARLCGLASPVSVTTVADIAGD